MRHESKRCLHCGECYLYQSSGPWADRYNDPEYCQGCRKVMMDALEAVPRLFERRSRPASEFPQFADVTPEVLRAWEAENTKEQEARGIVPFARRVFVGLFQMEGSRVTDSQNVREVKGRDAHRGVSFMFAEWRNESAPPEITVHAEFDPNTQKFTGRLWGV